MIASAGPEVQVNLSGHLTPNGCGFDARFPESLALQTSFGLLDPSVLSFKSKGSTRNPKSTLFVLTVFSTD